MQLASKRRQRRKESKRKKEKCERKKREKKKKKKREKCAFYVRVKLRSHFLKREKNSLSFFSLCVTLAAITIEPTNGFRDKLRSFALNKIGFVTKKLFSIFSNNERLIKKFSQVETKI